MFSYVALSAIFLVAGAQASIYLPNRGYPLDVALGGLPLGYGGLPLGERTIANSCQCTKTVVRPQLSQQIVERPAVERSLRSTITPVFENIRYNTNTRPSCGLDTVGPIDIGYPSVRGPIDIGYPSVRSVGCGLPIADSIVGASRYGLGVNEVLYNNAGLIPGRYVNDIVAGPVCGRVGINEVIY